MGCKSRETVALEKLKAARSQLVEAQNAARQSESARLEEQKKVVIIECEAERLSKVKEYEEARKAAYAAAEAAKKALEEAKIKEKEAAEAIKSHMKATGEAAALELKEKLDAVGGGDAKEDKNAMKEAAKAAALALKEIEKMRLEREKDRQSKIKEAQGLEKKKRPLAIVDGATGSPAKKARANDVD